MCSCSREMNILRQLDERSKFLHYNPRNVLLTSATHDHVNVYPSHGDYLGL